MSQRRLTNSIAARAHAVELRSTPTQPAGLRLVTISLLHTALLLLISGCKNSPKYPTSAASGCTRYCQYGFDWTKIGRVAVLPFINESLTPQAAEELREAVAGEIQRTLHFEPVLVTPDVGIACSLDLRINGEFDELELLKLANDHQVDAILFGTVTHYRAYQPPRVGLSLRLICPSEGVLVASVDGIWDASDHSVIEQTKAFYEGTLADRQSLLRYEEITASPRLFQRFAAHQAAQALRPNLNLLP